MWLPLANYVVFLQLLLVQRSGPGKITRSLYPPPQTKVIIPPANEVWGVYRNHPVCLSVRLFVCLSKVNLTFAITFESKEIRHSYYICGSLWQDLCVRTKNFDLVTLTFDLLSRKINLAYNFWTKRLSYYICWSLVTRAFFLYQKFWPCDLNLDFWPTFEQTYPWL